MLIQFIIVSLVPSINVSLVLSIHVSLGLPIDVSLALSIHISLVPFTDISLVPLTDISLFTFISTIGLEDLRFNKWHLANIPKYIFLFGSIRIKLTNLNHSSVIPPYLFFGRI